jgi:hydrogenase nickel incorporation protein HypB
MKPSRETCSPSKVLHLGKDLLASNRQHAAANRARFDQAGIVVVNLLSSPGSGKTALLERILSDLGDRWPMAVITGDLQTDNDGRRLAGRGAPVVTITTGTLCHLEASMIARACQELDLSRIRLLFIENVGNLVCPAGYDLGEMRRIVLMSVTEGEDKPLKYPLAFKSADAVVITKSDLAGPAGFRREEALANVAAIAPQAEIFELSVRTGEGMAAFYRWLEASLLSRSAATAHR